MAGCRRADPASSGANSPVTERAWHQNAAVWLLPLVGSVSACMGFGRLHYLHNADSILPVLVSIQRWTPFYWGQDRFGMLVPLLAIPFHNPLVNLMVQDWLMVAAALLAPFLIARYIGVDCSWFAAGSIANVFLLLMVTPRLQFEWLVSQPYALSITLGLAGLIVVERRTIVGELTAVLLVVLGALGKSRCLRLPPSSGSRSRSVYSIGCAARTDRSDRGSPSSNAIDFTAKSDRLTGLFGVAERMGDIAADVCAHGNAAALVNGGRDLSGDERRKAVVEQSLL
jgi:hypothetical protein